MDAELDTRLKRIEQMAILSAKEVLSVKDVSALTGFKESYVRKLVEECKLPYYKPMGKRIFFEKKDIYSFLRTNRVPSSAELVAQYMTRKQSTI